MNVAELSVEFVEQKLEQRKVQGDRKGPLIVLVSGPQGSGKSYNSEILFRSLKKKGVRAALTSIDDFYLTHEDQLKLQSAFPENKLLHGRGLPGTHDLKALQETLKELANDEDKVHDGKKIQLPVYDKSRFNGEGDRIGSIDIELPLDCVIIEGWFLGFQAITETELERKNSSPILLNHQLLHLKQVNRSLKEYGQLLWNNESLDTVGIKFATDDTNNVYRWRLQQEHAMLASQGEGMTDAQVKAFVDRYMPCYELYYKNFIDPNTAFGKTNLTIAIDADRNVVNHFISHS